VGALFLVDWGGQSRYTIPVTVENAKKAEPSDDKAEKARARLAGTGRNDSCP
jgi:hypothetical protein